MALTRPKHTYTRRRPLLEESCENMSDTSMSIFPLTYLGNSIIRMTDENELETIYEVLLAHYLDFLRKVMHQSRRYSQKLTTVMSECYSTVVLAIGQGKLILRFVSTEKCGEQTFRKHLEKRFSPTDLFYFNCYQLEVVTPMGEGERRCFTYFRRAIDTRRCVPEDALFELDDQLSTWLLRNRHLPRPPLVYCIVLNQKQPPNLICHVFLADNVQVGLRVYRCFSELRQAGSFDTCTPHTLHPYAYKNSQLTPRVNDRPTRTKHPPTHLAHRSRSTDSHLDSHSPLALERGLLHSKSRKNTRSHICRSCCDSLVDLNTTDTYCALCELECPFCCQSVLQDQQSDRSTSESENERRRRLQMRLGREALDYYHQAHEHRQHSRQRGGSKERLLESKNRPHPIRQQFDRLTVNNESTRGLLPRSSQHHNLHHHRIGRSKERRLSDRMRASRSAEGPRKTPVFRDSSLALLS